MKHKFLLLLAICSLSAVNAKELFVMQSAKEMTPTRNIKVNEKGFVIGKTSVIYSSRLFAFDPAKKYKLSCDAFLKNGKSGKLYLGFMNYDSNNRLISSVEVNGLPGTFTVLTEAAPAGSQILKLKDASKWNRKSRHASVALNASADNSDLPNRNIAAVDPDSIVQKEGFWEVKLKAPLKTAVAAGSGVRQHFSSYSYQFLAKPVLGGEVKNYSGESHGVAASGIYPAKAWKGTAKFRIVMLLESSESGAEVEFSQLKLEEL